MPWRSLALSCALLLTAVLAPTARAERVHLAQGTLALPPSLGERTVSGVAADAGGNVYVGARGSEGSYVVVFDREGQVVRSFDVGGIRGGVGSDGGCSCDELDLAVGSDGLLYVGQPIPSLGTAQGRYISVYTTSGSLVREIDLADEGTLLIGDLELDAAGNIHALVRHGGAGFSRGDVADEVLRIDPAGAIGARFALAPEETARGDSELGGLALAPDGSIWVTTPLERSRLIHFGADGGRLPAPPLDTIVRLETRSVEDVDFANGLLYVAAAKPNGMVVITPQGRLVDRVGGEARQLAIAGTSVYATKLAVGGAPVGVAQAAREERIAKFLSEEAKPPGASQSMGSRGSCANVDPTFGPDNIVDVNYPAATKNCTVRFVNYSTPRCSNGPAALPTDVYVGGRRVGKALIPGPDSAGATAFIDLDREQVGDGGSVVVDWACDGGLRPEHVFEIKGTIELIDPSGNVFDWKTGKPVEFATVRLDFKPAREGRFGTPSLSLMRPQVNPQTTGPDGAFAWDVAAGFWRLRVKAFGYKPFTSATFEIPPEVTGLRLRLRPSRAARKLIDPAGRVGKVRLGAKLRRRVAGLRVKVRRSRIREITVRRRSFRTAAGIRLRSRELDLLRAYPRAKRSGRARRGAQVLRFKRAFFTVRRGRVVAIRLARR